MKVITFNIRGAGVNADKKEAAVKRLSKLHSPDLFLLQEAVEEQEVWLAPNAQHMKRLKADRGEGGYVIAHGPNVSVDTFSFLAPYNTRDYRDLRPPLRIDCKWSGLCVQAYTWHAPAESFPKGGSKQAGAAVRAFLTAEINNITKAINGEFIWLLAGDLNLRSDVLRKIIKSVLPANLLPVMRIKTSVSPQKFDHQLMFYGSREKVLPKKESDKLGDSFSDHRWLTVWFPIGGMLGFGQQTVPC